MNDEIEMMKWILIQFRAVRGVYLPYQYRFCYIEDIKILHSLLNQYYTIKRYWEETR